MRSDTPSVTLTTHGALKLLATVFEETKRPGLAAQLQAFAEYIEDKPIIRLFASSETQPCTCHTHPVTGLASTRERREQCPVHRQVQLIDKRSDTSISFDAFRRANVTRCVKWHPAGIESWSPSDWLTAVTGELGELASLLKMRNRERDGLPGNKFSPTQKQIADELADVLTYLDLLAAALGVDLGAAAVEKFNEVSERVGFPDRIAATAPSATDAQDALRYRWLRARWDANTDEDLEQHTDAMNAENPDAAIDAAMAATDSAAVGNASTSTGAKK